MKSMSQTDYRRQAALLERVQGRIVGIGRIDESSVRDAYRRWAPVYDYTFGLIAREGRRHSVEVINSGNGRVLEVVVGTGLSLPDYERHLDDSHKQDRFLGVVDFLSGQHYTSSDLFQQASQNINEEVENLENSRGNRRHVRAVRTPVRGCAGIGFRRHE